MSTLFTSVLQAGRKRPFVRFIVTHSHYFKTVRWMKESLHQLVHMWLGKKNGCYSFGFLAYTTHHSNPPFPRPPPPAPTQAVLLCLVREPPPACGILQDPGMWSVGGTFATNFSCYWCTEVIEVETKQNQRKRAEEEREVTKTWRRVRTKEHEL